MRWEDVDRRRRRSDWRVELARGVGAHHHDGVEGAHDEPPSGLGYPLGVDVNGGVRGGRGRRRRTRRWCRGKVGVEHGPEVVELASWTQHLPRSRCGYRPWARRGLDTAWFCQHVKRCAACGKVLRLGLGVECPTRLAAEAQRVAEENDWTWT